MSVINLRPRIADCSRLNAKFKKVFFTAGALLALIVAGTSNAHAHPGAAAISHRNQETPLFSFFPAQPQPSPMAQKRHSYRERHLARRDAIHAHVRAAAVDHDDSELRQSRIMKRDRFNERDAGRKPASTFPHPALASQQQEASPDAFLWGEPQLQAQPQASPAESRRYQGHDQVHRNAAPVIGSAGNEETSIASHSYSSAVLTEARRWLGHGNVTGSHRAWCADFANMVLVRTGHRASGSGMVRSMLSVGPRVSSPSPGDVVVMRSHVTIFAGYGGRGFYGLGGNQHHRVAMSNYPLRSVVAFVRPD